MEVHPLLAELPGPPATTQWWLVRPSPMSFENIGFSKAVAGMQGMVYGAQARSQ